MVYTTWHKCNFPLQSIHKYWPRRHNKLQILLHNFQMLILVDPCILESRMKLEFLTSFSLKSLFYLVLTLSSKTCSISLTITNRTTYGTCTKTFVILKLSDNWHGFIWYKSARLYFMICNDGLLEVACVKLFRGTPPLKMCVFSHHRDQVCRPHFCCSFSTWKIESLKCTVVTERNYRVTQIKFHSQMEFQRPASVKYEFSFGSPCRLEDAHDDNVAKHQWRAFTPFTK